MARPECLPDCPFCKEPMVRTSATYACCPRGHGRLACCPAPSGKGLRDPAYGHVPSLLKAWANYLDSERHDKPRPKPVQTTSLDPDQRSSLERQLAALRSTKGEYAASRRAQLQSQLGIA